MGAEIGEAGRGASFASVAATQMTFGSAAPAADGRWKLQGYRGVTSLSSPIPSSPPLPAVAP